MTEKEREMLVAMVDYLEKSIYRASRAFHDSTLWSSEEDVSGRTFQDNIDDGFEALYNYIEEVCTND